WHRVFGNRSGEGRERERAEVHLARGEQGRGFWSAAREGHLQLVGLAVALEHALLHVVEEDDGLHLIRATAATSRVADLHRRCGAMCRKNRYGCTGCTELQYVAA